MSKTDCLMIYLSELFVAGFYDEIVAVMMVKHKTQTVRC
jgi:hypothetical protein